MDRQEDPKELILEMRLWPEMGNKIEILSEMYQIINYSKEEEKMSVPK